MSHGLVMSWKRILCAGLAAAAFALPSARPQSSGSPTTFSASAVKAAYIVNFIRFTDWPATALEAGDTPLVIGIAGNRELEDHLRKITTGKLLQGRRIRVLRLVVPGDAQDCHLIYIQSPASRSDTVTAATADWLQAVRGRPTLTVANEDGFVEKGGIINFYTDGNSLRFEISPAAAESAGLHLSSRLLALARIVRADASGHTSP